MGGGRGRLGQLAQGSPPARCALEGEAGRHEVCGYERQTQEERAVKKGGAHAKLRRVGSRGAGRRARQMTDKKRAPAAGLQVEGTFRHHGDRRHCTSVGRAEPIQQLAQGTNRSRAPAGGSGSPPHPSAAPRCSTAPAAATQLPIEGRQGGS